MPRYATSPFFGEGALYSGDDFICQVTYAISIDDEEVSGSLAGDAICLNRIDWDKPSLLKLAHDKPDKVKVLGDRTALDRIEFVIRDAESMRICREAARKNDRESE